MAEQKLTATSLLIIPLIFFPLNLLLIAPLTILGAGVALFLGIYEHGGRGQGPLFFMLGLAVSILSTLTFDGLKSLYRKLA